MRLSLYCLIAAAATCAFGQKLTSQDIPNPSTGAGTQPNWSVLPGGGVILSWVESAPDGTYSLRYATRKGAEWSGAQTVASKRKFFRHPAETPEVMMLGDHQWMAHWVEQPDSSSEAEFVYVASSTDGVHWNAPQMAHKDTKMVQHGLASMILSGPNEVSVFWLHTPDGEDGPGYLKRTVVDLAGKEIKEETLDYDVCSCCPTSVTKTAKGLLLAYRDRTPQDIRDISVVRLEGGKWSQPKNVHVDGWKLDACPINSASVAAKGNHAAVAWFTGAGDAPKEEIAFSEDGGVTWGKAATVSTARAFGNTSLTLDEDGGAIVSWLQQMPSGDTAVMVRKISAAGVAGPATQVATGGRQAVGYPRVVHSTAGTFLAWGGSKVSTAQIK